MTFDITSCVFFAACILRILSRMLITLNAEARSTLYFKSLHNSRPDVCISKTLRVVNFGCVSKHLGLAFQECPEHHVQRGSDVYV